MAGRAEPPGHLPWDGELGEGVEWREPPGLGKSEGGRGRAGDWPLTRGGTGSSQTRGPWSGPRKVCVLGGWSPALGWGPVSWSSRPTRGAVDEPWSWGIHAPKGRLGLREWDPSREKGVAFRGVALGPAESRVSCVYVLVGEGGGTTTPRCPGWRTDAANRLALPSACRLCNLPSSELWLGVACFNSSLRPVSASLYTGDLGRKARQPRGGPKGAGSDWSEATSCTFWQLPGSARLRPLCALLPVLPPSLAMRFNLTVFFSLFLPGFFWKFEPRFVPFSYLFRGGGSLWEMGTQRSVAKRILHTQTFILRVVHHLDLKEFRYLFGNYVVWGRNTYALILCACWKTIPPKPHYKPADRLFF